MRKYIIKHKIKRNKSAYLLLFTEQERETGMKLRKILLLTIMAAMAFSASADVIKLRPGAPERYVVKKGDTLWDLSGIYLSKPWLWPKIWKVNPQIKNPHLIYPGDVINLTYDAAGNPQLSINRNVKKLSPRKRIKLKTEQPIPTLPLRAIRPYITYEQSLSAEYLDSLPYVMGANVNSKNWIDSQIIYVNQALDPKQTYAIYRKGQAYTDIGEDEPLGFETVLVGIATVMRAGTGPADPAALKVKDAINEIKAGDKVLPVNEGQTLPAFFKISLPQSEVGATIIASPSDYREYSKYDVVVINRGDKHQLKVGNVLDIYHQSPMVVNDPENPRYLEDGSRFDRINGDWIGPSEDGTGSLLEMPKEKIGQLMVFKVYENLSYGFITNAERPIRIGDTTKSPEKI